LHVTFTCDFVAVITGGCVMENEAVPVHPLASVAVHVYVPGQSPEADAPVPPLGAHE
jgi:hypothetical protein